MGKSLTKGVFRVYRVQQAGQLRSKALTFLESSNHYNKHLGWDKVIPSPFWCVQTTIFTMTTRWSFLLKPPQTLLFTQKNLQNTPFPWHLLTLWSAAAESFAACPSSPALACAWAAASKARSRTRYCSSKRPAASKTSLAAALAVPLIWYFLGAAAGGGGCWRAFAFLKHEKCL